MSAEAISVGSQTAARARPRYFQLMSGLLLAIVLLGFARSFYLRPLFLPEALPTALIAHGSLLTVWFVLAFVQATLINADRTALHRTLGYAGAAWAAVVAASGFIATLGMAYRVHSLADREHMIVWGNFLTLAAFVVLVTAGVVRRNRAAAHRRYMLMASIAIIGPPLGRIPDWPGVPGGPPAAVAYAIGGILLLFASLMIFDRRTLGRVHAATWVGFAVTIGSIAGTVVLGTSPAALRLLQTTVN
jgi:hypothetical protein